MRRNLYIIVGITHGTFRKHRCFKCRACNSDVFSFAEKRHFLDHMRKTHPSYDYESEELRVLIRKNLWDSCPNISVLSGGKTYDGKVKRNANHNQADERDTVAEPIYVVAPNMPSSGYVWAVVTIAGKTRPTVKRVEEADLSELSYFSTPFVLSRLKTKGYGELLSSPPNYTSPPRRGTSKSREDSSHGSISKELTSDRLFCSYCDLRFASQREWELHIRTHYKPVYYTCEVCRAMQPSVTTKFQNHSQYLDHLNGHGLYRCAICDQNYDKENAYRAHIVSHVGQNNLVKCQQRCYVSIECMGKEHSMPGKVENDEVHSLPQLLFH